LVPWVVAGGLRLWRASGSVVARNLPSAQGRRVGCEHVWFWWWGRAAKAGFFVPAWCSDSLVVLPASDSVGGGDSLHDEVVDCYFCAVVCHGGVAAESCVGASHLGRSSVSVGNAGGEADSECFTSVIEYLLPHLFGQPGGDLTVVDEHDTTVAVVPAISRISLCSECQGEGIEGFLGDAVPIEFPACRGCTNFWRCVVTGGSLEFLTGGWA
jgi:hypothetical protein